MDLNQQNKVPPSTQPAQPIQPAVAKAVAQTVVPPPPTPSVGTQQPGVQQAESTKPAGATDVSFTPPPPPPKRKLPMKLIVGIAVVFLLLFIGIIAVAFLSGPKDPPPVGTDDLVFVPEKTPSAGPREHTVEEYPDFTGIAVGPDTVAFNKVDDSFRILYRGKIYHEQDTGAFLPRKVNPETADDYEWHGLVEAPSDLATASGVGDQLFSFKAPPTYRSFVFIMRWDRPTGEVYEMYRFHNNGISKLTEFTKTRAFYVPKLHEFSLGGNFISINIFSCPTCTDEEPEVLLYHIPSGEIRTIGRVSYFAWGKDDNAYEYKEYRPGVDPELVPLLKNDFFVRSIDILNP